MSGKAIALAMSGALVVGILFGQATDTVETKYKVLHDTETVTKTVEVKVPTPPPSECKDLVIHARTISEAGGKLDSASAEMLDIMSRLRVAVASSDSNEVNTLETELRALDGRTVGAVEAMGVTQPELYAAAAACLNGVTK